MLLSALTLVALLQAAPATPPVMGQKGYLLQQQPFDLGKPLEKNSGPFVQPSRRLTAEEARARGSVDTLRIPPPRKAKPPQPRKKQFALGPAPCKTTKPEHVANTDGLMRQPLSKMPMAHTEYAVARTVDGCPVAVLVASAGPVR